MTASALEVDLSAVNRSVRHAGRPVTVVWVVLMLATLLSWWLGDGHGSTDVAAVLVIVTAFVNVALIGEHFVELREAPPQLRFAFLDYCVVLPAVLVGIYLVRAWRAHLFELHHHESPASRAAGSRASAGS